VMPRWGAMESYRLIQILAKLPYQDASEINWREVTAKADWIVWSEHEVQRKWVTMKRTIEGSDALPYLEVMDILKAKFADPPRKAATKARVQSAEGRPSSTVFKSSDFVDDDEEGG